MITPTIRYGWDGLEGALQISKEVLPNETAGRFYLEERKPFVRLMTAWIDDRVVGYLIVEFDDEREFLREIGVLPELQGQRIGRTLVHAYASSTEVEELWCRPLPYRQGMFAKWGFSREDGGDRWGKRSHVVRSTTIGA